MHITIHIRPRWRGVLQADDCQFGGLGPDQLGALRV